MTEFLPFVWRKAYRSGLDKIAGYDLKAAHEKARQYLTTSSAKKPHTPTTGTK